MRRAFHEELDQLKADVIRLAAMAGESIQAATQILLNADLGGVDQVVQNDAPIDDLTHSVEERAYLLLARQQPMAVDLRVLVMTLRLIHELERIGDLMVKIAKMARRMYPYELPAEVRGVIRRMGDQAAAQLRLATDAFADSDPARAAAVADMDDVMDDLQKELFQIIFSDRTPDQESVQRGVQLALIARYYERTADHAVNVAERVPFIVTGDFGSISKLVPDDEDYEAS